MSEDPEIAQLEAELRESRFQAWDAERFLIERHEAKIAELSKDKGRWRDYLLVAKEMSDAVCVIIGRGALLVMLGLWLLTGDFLGRP